MGRFSWFVISSHQQQETRITNMIAQAKKENVLLKFFHLCRRLSERIFSTRFFVNLSGQVSRVIKGELKDCTMSGKSMNTQMALL